MQHMKWGLAASVTACLSLAAASALAQTSSSMTTHTPGSGPVQVAIDAGAFVTSAGVAPDLRLTAIVPRSQQLSLEGFVSFGPDSQLQTYGFEVKQLLRKRQQKEVFATLGAMSFAPNAWVGLIGLGIQERVTAHAAVRFDCQFATIPFVPVGVRMAAGVTIPLGRSF